ncbi:MAG TPA: SUMF1/EgtB/PvdO family nonheme iron enzyme [Verrucomicrobiota bacterium]|nr:SUMF1/EgtB/PvdO family nonheme iron enzyme [Verrucomicrobiota bacterium]
MNAMKSLSAVAVVGIILGLTNARGQAQPIVIESLRVNGELTCTGLEPGSSATVEWAPTVDGPWTNSWAGLDAVTVDATGTIHVAVPMFYRVRGEPMPPPGMVLIPAGSFQMGDSFGEGDSAELPVHMVTVSAFYMDRTMVTKALWDEVYQWATDHGYSFLKRGSSKAASHPVYFVSWYDVVKWCNARSEKEERVPAYYTSGAMTTVYRTGQVDVQNDWVKWNTGYRLPTEAEWECAARGGFSGRRFPWGDTISHSQANYRSYWKDGRPYYPYDVNPTEGYHPTYATGGTPYTSPVGSFEPNGYGLYDMTGNAVAWCWDLYEGTYYEASSSLNPRGPASGGMRVLRGSGWYAQANRCRVSYRSGMAPTDTVDYISFRCVLLLGR